MFKHRERTFEDEIVEHLTAHGWLMGDASKYNRELALYPDDVIGWLEDTQPQEVAKVEKLHNGGAAQAVLTRLREVLDKDGTLHVLRRPVKHVNARFEFCQFRPATSFNPATLERYAKVRCRVVRQVRYSLHNENAIDLVFFVNGIPVATAELKTDFTQHVKDAIAQYRKDRLPRDPVTNRDEPLLQFSKRALVHFAVSTDEVWMTTRLEGPQTRFLPFNIGHEEGADNPPNPDGYRTAYLWERVLQRDSLLNILGNFLHLERKEREDSQGRKIVHESLIFPRFHQWEAVNKLVGAARTEGPGQNYLIQHSAGSGKSNSIAWLAHRLASLHDGDDRKIFNSVIVVTDRTVLDSQLQETIYQFEHKEGVVIRITDEGIKSAQLVTALINSAPIIIVTLQTFPFVLDAIRQQTSLRERTFAVIADEAHSSQTGSAASALSRVLASEQIEEGAELSVEDVLLADMEQRAEHANISYFAFTATPKSKTLMRFGRRPYPDQPPSDANKPDAFHTYSMQQAIEEGFILDVLQNYTPYKLAFRLAHRGKDYDDLEVDRSAAMKGLMQWVRLHPYNISQKVRIIVEHFRENVMTLLDGRAKAMVVTGSRKEAVRYKQAIDKYIQQQSYNLATLVAFSGEVHDPDSGPDPFSETSMNPGLKGRDIREAFKTDEYQILLVANKFQTGFDEPLLCAMYVDKRLDGITAVQTLSRLNRVAPGKTTTYVLDFVNEPQTILDAFLPYYKQAKLGAVTDPNVVHEIQAKLDAQRIYTDSEIEAFVEAYLKQKGTQGAMQAAIAPAVDRFRVRWREATDARDKQRQDELDLFRTDLMTFVRAYEFLSQIINYGDLDLEKRTIFFRHLAPLLEIDRLHEAIDLSGVKLTHYKLKHQGAQQLRLRESDGDYRLDAPTEIGSGAVHDPVKARLTEIIQKLNDLFEGELSDADVLSFATHIRDKMIENPTLRQQAASNTKEQFALGDFRKAMMNAVVAGMSNYQSMGKQVLSNERVREGFATVLLDIVYEALRSPNQPGTGS
jgi:type I restriction enzyme, R subunit